MSENLIDDLVLKILRSRLTPDSDITGVKYKLSDSDVELRFIKRNKRYFMEISRHIIIVEREINEHQFNDIRRKCDEARKNLDRIKLNEENEFLQKIIDGDF